MINEKVMVFSCLIQLSNQKKTIEVFKKVLGEIKETLNIFHRLLCNQIEQQDLFDFLKIYSKFFICGMNIKNNKFQKEFPIDEQLALIESKKNNIEFYISEIKVMLPYDISSKLTQLEKRYSSLNIDKISVTIYQIFALFKINQKLQRIKQKNLGFIYQNRK